MKLQNAWDNEIYYLRASKDEWNLNGTWLWLTALSNRPMNVRLILAARRIIISSKM